MPVSNINDGTGSQIILASRKKPETDEFSKALSSASSKTPKTSLQPETVQVAEKSETDKSPFIELGRISKETPTVSHILKNHPEYSRKCWDIIFSSENNGKHFRKMKEGTMVALNPDSNELLWGRELTEAKEKSLAAASESADNETRTVTKAVENMVIGTISKDMPTVSHLFQANSNFDSRFWNIIHAPVNSNKKYTALRPGTQVVLNTMTRELSFKYGSARLDTEMAGIKKNEQNHHESLADAVKPYIGTPYNKIDCYGLIVRGLQNQGIQYKGRGGIREKLVRLATRNGLPGNAYFNGEGLVNKAGTKVFSKSMLRVFNAQKQAEQVYAEIKPHLQEGLILSFSTPSQGHTGVVSREGEDWTYINSGVIDNQVTPVNVPKGVGEEFLKAELKNWMVLAADKRESLMVTIGHVGNI